MSPAAKALLGMALVFFGFFLGLLGATLGWRPGVTAAVAITVSFGGMLLIDAARREEGLDEVAQ